jgi:hypothetical protein
MRPVSDAEIIQAIARHFPCFGKGAANTEMNPLARAMQDRPLSFALGVDVGAVVRFVRQIGEFS